MTKKLVTTMFASQRRLFKEIMYKYSKEGLFNAFGINHSYDTDEVVMLEVWMKEGEYDKSMNYGFDLPNGTGIR